MCKALGKIPGALGMGGGWGGKGREKIKEETTGLTCPPLWTQFHLTELGGRTVMCSDQVMPPTALGGAIRIDHGVRHSIGCRGLGVSCPRCREITAERLPYARFSR